MSLPHPKGILTDFCGWLKKRELVCVAGWRLVASSWCVCVMGGEGGRGADEGLYILLLSSSPPRQLPAIHCLPWLRLSFGIHHSATLELFVRSTRVSHQTIHSSSIWELLRATGASTPHLQGARTKHDEGHASTAQLAPPRSAPVVLLPWTPRLQSPVRLAWLGLRTWS